MGAQTINSTLMSEIANSYIDKAYADAYWLNDYRTKNAAQWAALSDAQKTGLLIDACAIIERIRFTLPESRRDYVLFYDRRTQLTRMIDRNFQPFKYLFSQRLQFPRNLDIYVMDAPSPELLGQTYIRQEVMDAQCEQAMYLLNFDDSIYAARLQGVVKDSVGIGKGSITSDQEYALGSSISMVAPRAFEKLSALMVVGGRLGRA